MLKEVICNLCGSRRHVVVYKTPGNRKGKKKQMYLVTEKNLVCPERIVKCTRCGLIFVTPREDDESLLSNYIEMVDKKYIEEEEGRRITARSIIKKLNKAKKYGNRLLDIGCCTGFLLDEARKAGWEVCGVELSKWAAEYAKEKFQLEIYNTTLEKAKFPHKYFDAVVMQDTIEHLLHPKETLIEIRRILKPNGILYINTPDIESLASKLLRARWWGINQFHLYYFSKRTLNKLLEASGFKGIKWSLYSRTFSLKYWMERFESYNKTIYKILVFISRIDALKKKLFRVNLRDQIEVLAKRCRKLEYLDELEESVVTVSKKKMKTVVVLPAYNASKTLRATFNDIPKDIIDDIILVDDNSKDNTVQIAKELGIKVFVHKKNKGYGANQKTCYNKALEMGADIVVMVHPDYQYDPRAIVDLIAPIKNGQADAVFGSRMMKGGALMGGMPLWKHNANILLTALENVVLNTYLTEYHSGFRAYSARLLKTIRFNDNSDGFVFDTEIVIQALLHYFRIEEVPIRTRYFDEASTIKLWPSILYGLGILKTLFKYILHVHNIKRFKQFE